MKTVLIGLVGALALVVGCGGSSAPLNTGAAGSSGAGGSSATGPACTNTTACGGNIVGIWTITDSCVGSGDLSEPTTDCPGQTSSTTNFGFSGSVVYNDDGSYTATTSTTGNVIIKYPSSCLTTISMTCDGLSQGVMAELDMPDAAFTAVSCATTPTACICTLVVNPATSTEIGRYMTTAAGALTQVPANGTPGNSSYCVTGNKLTLSPDAASLMMGQSVMETITLMKQ
jgi:hypothetical protein